MNQVLHLLSRLITARPYLTIGVLFVITIVLGAGGALRAEIDETDGYFPPTTPSFKHWARSMNSLVSQARSLS